jgi:hypothetical protein
MCALWELSAVWEVWWLCALQCELL